jgi:ABC-2 type transport system ATP-binding protein
VLIFVGLGAVFAIVYWVRSRGRPRLNIAEPRGATGPAGSLVLPVAVGDYSGQSDRGRIVAAALSKRFGSVRAVDGLSFRVEPGRVTGFLGPNGAGKTTTLRMILGLVAPTGGSVTIGGLRYAELVRPARHVGAVLETETAHPGRSGRDHLRVLCQAAGIPGARVGEVLALVGLAGAADRKVKEYSLGMRQRLGIAAALLGDPQVLILDEPANGLDPEGIHWLRDVLTTLAAAGRTVLISSHLLAEMQQLADDVIIIAAGRVLAQGTLTDVIGGLTAPTRTLVRTNDVAALRAALGDKAEITSTADGSFCVTGVDTLTIGVAAHAAGIVLEQLTTQQPDLEEAFLTLTRSMTEARS